VEKSELRKILESSTFGKRTAEEEGRELSSYFVETDLWRRISTGDIDVVLGAKGAGKSAIYSLLLERRDEFAKRRIDLIAGENPRGATAFADLISEPPASEQEFVGMWKLYVLALIAGFLRDNDIKSDKAGAVIEAATKAELIPFENNLTSLASRVLAYAKAVFRPKDISASADVNAATGTATVSTKISFREPSKEDRERGVVRIDDLLRQAEEALEASDHTVWLLLDRLDVAFLGNAELEKNALRALFRVYLDLIGHRRIVLKVFLRADIWSRITEEGFQEASHITRQDTIRWEKNTLMNLVIRRAVRNSGIRDAFSVDATEVLSALGEQEKLFYRMYPNQVEAGTRKSKTFDWMLSHTHDGSRTTAPRELIHLVEQTRLEQLKELDIGAAELTGDELFSAGAIKKALVGEVSTARLTQTLYAEYPKLKASIEALRKEKTEHSAATLAHLWKVDEVSAERIASELVEIGFFERRGTREQPEYWVPFLYRGALQLVQGAAEEEE
jgi:hypothetical protein